jgi:hypothetical protein
MQFRVSPPTSKRVTLSAKVAPFLVAKKVEQQRITIKIDGESIGSWTLEAPGLRLHTLGVPAERLQGETFELSFELPDAAVPREFGVNEDVRSLAALFQSLNLVDDGGATVILPHGVGGAQETKVD